MDVENCAFFPLELVMHVTDEVGAFGRTPGASPGVVLLGVRLKLGDVRGPAGDILVVIGGQIWENKGQDLI